MPYDVMWGCKNYGASYHRHMKELPSCVFGLTNADSLPDWSKFSRDETFADGLLICENAKV